MQSDHWEWSIQLSQHLRIVGVKWLMFSTCPTANDNPQPMENFINRLTLALLQYGWRLTSGRVLHGHETISRSGNISLPHTLPYPHTNIRWFCFIVRCGHSLCAYFQSFSWDAAFLSYASSAGTEDAGCSDDLSLSGRYSSNSCQSKGYFMYSSNSCQSKGYFMYSSNSCQSNAISCTHQTVSQTSLCVLLKQLSIKSYFKYSSNNCQSNVISCTPHTTVNQASL